MTKLERWAKGFEEAASKAEKGCACLSKGGPGKIYTRDRLHLFGLSGDAIHVLCTDGETIGFHRTGECPFLQVA